MLQHQTKIIIGHHHPKSQCQQLNSDRLTEGYFNRGRRKKRTIIVTKQHRQHGTKRTDAAHLRRLNMVLTYQTNSKRIENMAPRTAMSTPTRTITPWPGCLKTILGHTP